MQFGETTHERKSETGAAGLTIVAIVDLVEGLEDLVDLFARDTRSVVAHGDLEAAVARESADDGNPSTFRCELHRIRTEVDQDLLERAVVGVERRRGGIDFDRQLLATLARLGADQLERQIEGALGIERMRPDFHLARFDLGDVEKIVDEAEEMRAGGVDVASIFLVAR